MSPWQARRGQDRLEGVQLPSCRICETMTPNVQLLVPQRLQLRGLNISISIYLKAAAAAVRFLPSSRVQNKKKLN